MSKWKSTTGSCTDDNLHKGKKKFFKKKFISRHLYWSYISQDTVVDLKTKALPVASGISPTQTRFSTMNYTDAGNKYINELLYVFMLLDHLLVIFWYLSGKQASHKQTF